CAKPQIQLLSSLRLGERSQWQPYCYGVVVEVELNALEPEMHGSKVAGFAARDSLKRQFVSC
ncbi:MAG TPA: hypothetical protein V6C63_07625, partial [Allocoleopsis sp.]